MAQVGDEPMTHLRVEVREDAGCWSVYVNGLRLVDRESFTLAHRIAEGVEKPGVHWPSEADDVSASILAWLEHGGAP